MIISNWYTYPDKDVPRSSYDAFDIYWEEHKKVWVHVGLKKVDIEEVWGNGCNWRDRRTWRKTPGWCWRVKEWLKNLLNKMFGRG